MDFNGLSVIIPTRNRADLTPKAIQSVLTQADSNVRLIVSDNSTSAQDIASLAKYCEGLKDSRLTYLRPPEPMPMSRHWEWALQQALLETEITHFSYLTDRMMFRPNSLEEITNIARRYPEKIVCYLHDRVSDFRPPYRLDQNEWTGKLYEVAATRLLSLSANSVIYDGCVPRMLNCFVPRSVLDSVRMRFGSVFSSISPDWNFAYRALEVVDSLLYFHKAQLVHYSLARSNGWSAHLGIRNSAIEQFFKDLEMPVNSKAPYPEIITVWNGLIHEYCSVKEEAQSAKFPELDLAAYRQSLAAGIAAIEDPVLKLDMETKLQARGGKSAVPRSFARKLVSPRTIVNKVKFMFSEPYETGPYETADHALEEALTRTRPRSKSVPWEEALHEGVEVPIEPK